MYGIQLTLPEDIDVAELLGKLAQHSMDIQLSRADDAHHYSTCTIKVKSWLNISGSIKKFYGGDCKETSYCWVSGCFSEALIESCSKEVQAACLHNRHGEEMHDIYEECKRHASPYVHQQLKSMEIIDLPASPYCTTTAWEKVAVWRGYKRWYSQKTHQYRDGDHECGYYDCLGASPWLGPFETKELAIEAGKAYSL